MKKRILFCLTGLMLAFSMAGCSAPAPAATEAATTAAGQESAGSMESAGTMESAGATESAGSMESAGSAESADAGETASADDSNPVLRIGSLKGPTSMGLVSLMQAAKQGDTQNQYEFLMVTAADELLAKVVSREVDIALLPANVGSILCSKTQGAVSVININTLGVLDVVSGDESVAAIPDLKGRTVYLTGKGTTPDYVLRYLLDKNGLSPDDLTLEYKSEPTEVAALLKEKPEAIGILPQPFVTAATTQNPQLKVVMDLTREWDSVSGNTKSQLVTGVTLVQNELLSTRPEAVDRFLSDHKASADFINANPAEGAQLVADAGIIEKAAIAEKAIPYCNITCLTGAEMKTALSGYLQVLFEQDAKSVGGQLPGDDFYYLGN